MWTEPKVDWAETDYINYNDYNRIKNNIEYLRELALKLFPDFSFSDMGNDKSGYSEIPYADEFNLIEKNLKAIRDNTYKFYSTGSKTWYENRPTPTYEDLNRIESACLKMYQGLTKQLELKSRLSIRLGHQRGMVKA